jgi:hypothetical protein
MNSRFLSRAQWNATLHEGLYYFTDPSHTIDRLWFTPAKPPWKNDNDWQPPTWLNAHGPQGTCEGYIQFENDKDTSGRHDHLLGNAVLQFYSRDFLRLPRGTEDDSPTDVFVNELGRQLGALWPQGQSGAEITKWLYDNLCDEKKTCKCNWRNKGPLTDVSVAGTFGH